MSDAGIAIGMSNKIKKYERIVGKLLRKEELDEEDKAFLNKQGFSSVLVGSYINP